MNNAYFYYDMSKRQDNIKKWLSIAKEKEGISQAFFAKRIGMKPQNLNYHLNESPELDLDLYQALLKELKKFVEIPDTESEETPSSLNNNPILYEESSEIIISNEDIRLLKRLKEMGIDTVEKLERLYNIEDLTEDIRKVIENRFLKKK